MGHAGDASPPPSPSPEADRLKILAEKTYLSGDLKSALKHAKKAHRLNPTLPGLQQMLAALRVLRSPSSDHYRTLLLDPFSQLSSIKTQYKSLALLLHPDRSPFPGCEDAFKRVGEAFGVLSDRVRRREYDLRLRIELQKAAEKESDGAPVEAFWTACETCRVFHEFDRRYLGQRLICPGCRKSFVAVEVKVDGENGENEVGVGGSSRVRSRARSDRGGGNSRVSSLGNVGKEKEPTLAEMQKEALRLKSREELSEKRDELPRKLRKRAAPKEDNEFEYEEGSYGGMAVEDSDFYDFDRDRVEKSFRKGQVWAVYDGVDGMPRHYGLVDEVLSTNPFKLKLNWLELQGDAGAFFTISEKNLSDVPCGRFKVGEMACVDSPNMFSHVACCERAASQLYRIFPNKGSVWALYGEETDDGGKGRCYEIVVLLTNYSEMYGLSMGYLEKVDGFKTIFRRREIGVHAVRWLEKDDFRSFSHQIPARKLTGSEGPNLPKECWELDPASLPKNLPQRT